MKLYNCWLLRLKIALVLAKASNAEGEELHRRLHLLFRAGLALQAAANQVVLSVRQDDLVTDIAVSCGNQRSAFLFGRRFIGY